VSAAAKGAGVMKITFTHKNFFCILPCAIMNSVANMQWDFHTRYRKDHKGNNFKHGLKEKDMPAS
jgi:hypothetical protein